MPAIGLPTVLFDRFQLRSVQSRLDLSGTPRINLIQAFGNRFGLVTVEELGDRASVELAAGNPKPAGHSVGLLKQVIRQRDGCLHTLSITRVIPQGVAA